MIFALVFVLALLPVHSAYYCYCDKCFTAWGSYDECKPIYYKSFTAGPGASSVPCGKFGRKCRFRQLSDSKDDDCKYCRNEPLVQYRKCVINAGPCNQEFSCDYETIDEPLGGCNTAPAIFGSTTKFKLSYEDNAIRLSDLGADGEKFACVAFVKSFFAAPRKMKLEYKFRLAPDTVLYAIKIRAIDAFFAKTHTIARMLADYHDYTYYHYEQEYGKGCSRVLRMSRGPKNNNNPRTHKVLFGSDSPFWIGFVMIPAAGQVNTLDSAILSWKLTET